MWPRKGVLSMPAFWAKLRMRPVLSQVSRLCGADFSWLTASRGAQNGGRERPIEPFQRRIAQDPPQAQGHQPQPAFNDDGQQHKIPSGGQLAFHRVDPP